MQAGAQEAAAALSRLLRVPVQADAFTSLDARQLGAAHGERVVVVALEARFSCCHTASICISGRTRGALYCPNMSSRVASSLASGFTTVTVQSQFGQ
jgi:hypothetical protein